MDGAHPSRSAMLSSTFLLLFCSLVELVDALTVVFGFKASVHARFIVVAWM